MTDLDSILKSRDITLPTKICLVKAMVFPVVMYGWESWTVKMAGWHHWDYGCKSEWTPGVGDGQGGLACCDSWGRKELDTTERLNWTELVAQTVKNLPAVQETLVQSLGWEYPLEKGSSPVFLPGESSSWTEEPGGLQFMGLQSQTWLSNYVQHDYILVI